MFPVNTHMVEDQQLICLSFCDLKTKHQHAEASFIKGSEGWFSVIQGLGYQLNDPGNALDLNIWDEQSVLKVKKAESR